AILYDEAPPPSHLQAPVPAAVEELLATLLQKEPARGCRTADDLLVSIVEIGNHPGACRRSGRVPWPPRRQPLPPKHPSPPAAPHRCAVWDPGGRDRRGGDHDRRAGRESLARRRERPGGQPCRDRPAHLRRQCENSSAVTRWTASRL